MIRRLLRRLFTAVSALSLLLCVATVVLWVRSYWREDSVVFRNGGPVRNVYWREESVGASGDTRWYITSWTGTISGLTSTRGSLQLRRNVPALDGSSPPPWELRSERHGRWSPAPFDAGFGRSIRELKP